MVGRKKTSQSSQHTQNKFQQRLLLTNRRMNENKKKLILFKKLLTIFHL